MKKIIKLRYVFADQVIIEDYVGQKDDDIQKYDVERHCRGNSRKIFTAVSGSGECFTLGA